MEQVSSGGIKLWRDLSRHSALVKVIAKGKGDSAFWACASLSSFLGH